MQFPEQLRYDHQCDRSINPAFIIDSFKIANALGSVGVLQSGANPANAVHILFHSLPQGTNDDFYHRIARILEAAAHLRSTSLTQVRFRHMNSVVRC